MARDIRDLFKDDKISHEKMPKNHQDRFLKKLNQALPEKPIKPSLSWVRVAASIVVLLGISFGVYKYNQAPEDIQPVIVKTTPESLETKTLGDISPDLKKVEDYYLASINLELSKIKPTVETKELFDGYLSQLKELDEEYKLLSVELTESGPTELTINALIDNLKFRLNLLYRLRSQFKQFNRSDNLEAVKKTL